MAVDKDTLSNLIRSQLIAFSKRPYPKGFQRTPDVSVDPETGDVSLGELNQPEFHGPYAGLFGDALSDAIVEHITSDASANVQGLQVLTDVLSHSVNLNLAKVYHTKVLATGRDITITVPELDPEDRIGLVVAIMPDYVSHAGISVGGPEDENDWPSGQYGGAMAVTWPDFARHSPAWDTIPPSRAGKTLLFRFAGISSVDVGEASTPLSGPVPSRENRRVVIEATEMMADAGQATVFPEALHDDPGPPGGVGHPGEMTKDDLSVFKGGARIPNSQWEYPGVGDGNEVIRPRMLVFDAATAAGDVFTIDIYGGPKIDSAPWVGIAWDLIQFPDDPVYPHAGQDPNTSSKSIRIRGHMSDGVGVGSYNRLDVQPEGKAALSLNPLPAGNVSPNIYVYAIIQSPGYLEGEGSSTKVE